MGSAHAYIEKTVPRDKTVRHRAENACTTLAQPTPRYARRELHHE